VTWVIWGLQEQSRWALPACYRVGDHSPNPPIRRPWIRLSGPAQLGGEPTFAEARVKRLGSASYFEIVIGIPTFSIRPMVVWNKMLRGWGHSGAPLPVLLNSTDPAARRCTVASTGGPAMYYIGIDVSTKESALCILYGC
jgi:hypothetical protein